MSKITALPYLYFTSAKDAARTIITHWILIPLSLAAFLAFLLLLQLLAPLGFGGGLLAGLIKALLLSLFYLWIREAHTTRKLDIREFFQFDYGLLVSIISVGFIFFIAEYIVGSLVLGLKVQWIPLCLSLGILLVFNPIPEVIISQGLEGLSALSRAYNFVLEHWIEWFLPHIIILVPLFAAQPEMLLVLLAQTDPLFPLAPLMQGVSLTWLSSGAPYILLFIVQATIGLWFVLFRLALFKNLDEGRWKFNTRRL